jgi:hypothetical protein
MTAFVAIVAVGAAAHAFAARLIPAAPRRCMER